MSSSASPNPLEKEAMQKYLLEHYGDASGPRKKQKGTKKRKREQLLQQKQQKQQRTNTGNGESDSDLSVPRKRDADAGLGEKTKHKKEKDREKSDLQLGEEEEGEDEDDDSDIFPLRRTTLQTEKRPRDKHGHNVADSDSDMSPVRRLASQKHPPAQSKEEEKGVKMVSGMKAGLQTAQEIRESVHRLRQQQQQNMQNDPEFLRGKNAETVQRDKKSLKILPQRRPSSHADEMNPKTAADTDSDTATATTNVIAIATGHQPSPTQPSASAHKEQEEEEYEWGTGQPVSKKQRGNADGDLATKTGAIHIPVDMNRERDRIMKSKARWGDPMLNLIKTQGQGHNVTSKSVYRGPPAPPNRFGIAPGPRWDGTNRSNGYEMKLFAKQRDLREKNELAYKWSVEDM